MADPWAKANQTIRIVVVDGQRQDRQALTAVVNSEPDLMVVAEAASGPDAITVSLDSSPDIVLMDVAMPGLDGIETCRRLRALMPSTKVLMLTTSDDEQDLLGALRAGACGYLLKTVNAAGVAAAVRAAHHGHAMIPPSMAADLVSHAALTRPRAAVAAPHLTDREIEVLQFVARGAQNREIAQALVISESTVKNHVRNILDKLRVHSRAEAATFAVRANLIEDLS